MSWVHRMKSLVSGVSSEVIMKQACLLSLSCHIPPSLPSVSTQLMWNNQPERETFMEVSPFLLTTTTQLSQALQEREPQRLRSSQEEEVGPLSSGIGFLDCNLMPCWSEEKRRKWEDPTYWGNKMERKRSECPPGRGRVSEGEGGGGTWKKEEPILGYWLSARGPRSKDSTLELSQIT